MLNLKKLMVFACGAVLALSTTMISASAASDANILTGSKHTSTGVTSIKVNVSNIASSATADTADFTTNGLVMIKVEKGVFSIAKEMPMGANGLHSVDDFGDPVTPTWNVALNTTASSEYDVINVGWFGDVPCFTTTGDIVEVQLKYTSTVKEVPMTVLADSYITTCKSDGSNVSPTAKLAENKNTYTLAADSSTVTKTEPSSGPTEVITTATTAGEKEATAIGDTYYGDKDTTDTAVAYGAGLKGEADKTYTNVLWTVTANGETKYHKSPVNVSGEATYKIGLVIQGLTKDMVSVVKAVLAE